MELKTFWKNLKEFIDKLLCPKNLTCNLCGKEVFNDQDFCEDCKKVLKLNDNIYCDCCGRQTNIPTKRCYSCSGEWAIDKARSVFLYQGGAEKLIKDIKYGGKQFLTEILAEYLKDIYIKNYFAPDLITYVPMTLKAQQKRGFNQSRLLGENLAKITDNRCIGLLTKTFDTTDQKELTREERNKNLLKCFKVIDKKQIKDKRILLVDDVLTTGATAHAVAKTLKKAGAKSVYLITIASVQREII